MKRIQIGTALGSLGLAMLAPSFMGCELDIKVDDAKENPGILAPTGIIRGTLSYLGPPPCFKNGEVEGAVVILLFAYDNPPPPDGLASSALNFATVPGAKLFENVAPPTSGPGSTKSPKESFCPSVSSAPINAATTWSMQQIAGGRYQVRAFYSRQNRFNPLFNFGNLPLAGDVPGGALENPLAPVPKMAQIEVGVPDKTGALVIPPTGFIRDGVPISMGGPLKTNRPFFHIDYEKSVSFAAPDPITPGGPKILADFCGTPGCPTVSGATPSNWTAQRKMLTPAEAKANGFVTFPQDHLSTSQSNLLCFGDRTPSCDAFQYAQGSFPQIRFKYGFPGKLDNLAEGTDAWVMKNGKPKDPFNAEKARPYYGIDPKEFVGDIPSSGKFVITRNFDSAGKPEIIRDNDTLESVAQIADIFPSVVLSKLVEDGEGNVALPPRSQTDPIVVIQTMPLKDWDSGPLAGTGSMKATSESIAIGGGLTKPDPADPEGKASLADPSNVLSQRTSAVLQDGFTALIRPSVVCIYPQVDLKGTLVTPVQTDPNPGNKGAALVNPAKILKYKSNRVKDVRYGCLPPGHYSVNVVYPTGQAWSFPNLSGHCSYSARFEPNEECMTPNKDLTGGFASTFVPSDPFKALNGINKDVGFPMRPLVKSQMLFQVDDTGKPMVATDPITGRTFYVPQVVVIKPSPRCGDYHAETEFACNADADCKDAPFSGVCMAGPGGKKFCDYNGDGKISTGKVWINNPINEDTSLDPDPNTMSEKSANGLLDDKEDVNGNGRLDLKVPYTCSLPFAKFQSLVQKDSSKQFK